jgi:hypothetical protein
LRASGDVILTFGGKRIFVGICRNGILVPGTYHTIGIAGISRTIPAQKEWNSGSRKEFPGTRVQNCRNDSRNA